VVDFGETGYGAAPVAGCADDAPATGIEALTQAGFGVEQVASIPGMVCRINLLPDTECGAAPPPDGYWSYWYAAPDDTEWTYSQVGAAGRTPVDPGLEGWAFGDGAPPRLAPADAAPTGHDATEPQTAPPTWILSVVALAVIAALAVWRLRRDPKR
jgi:hypothetical protein